MHHLTGAPFHTRFFFYAFIITHDGETFHIPSYKQACIHISLYSISSHIYPMISPPFRRAMQFYGLFPLPCITNTVFWLSPRPNACFCPVEALGCLAENGS